MTYVPRKTETRWLADQVVADIRLHPGSTQAQSSDRIGLSTAVTLGTFQVLVRHGVLSRWRLQTADIWRYSLGPEAPPEIAASDLEALMDNVGDPPWDT